MATTIQISETLQKKLMNRKMSENETYEEVIWDMLEDVMELSEDTKQELMEARKEIKEGKVYSFEQVKRELND